MNKLIISALGYLIGFGGSMMLWGKGVGERGWLPNARIALLGKTIYLHHWMGFLFLGIILAYVQVKTRWLPEIWFWLIMGILVGGVNQGWLYEDWMVILK